MIRFETEQTIGRSADDVWAYAADILRHPEWMGVTDARILRGTGSEAGSSAIEHVKMGARTVEVEVSVTEAILARRLRWTVAGRSPLRGDVTLELEPLGADQTQAVWSGSMGMRGLWRLPEPLMAGEVEQGEAAELRRLKANLEKTPAMP
jgi:uncharacterized membrane protein